MATTSTPAGSLHCQKDSYARELITTVVSCAEHNPDPVPPTGGGKKKKKGDEAAPSKPAVPTYHVVLADSVLFPEGGVTQLSLCPGGLLHSWF